MSRDRARRSDGVFVPPEAWSGESVSIRDSEHHHLARVLRYRAGDRVESVDGAGGRATLEIVTVGRDATECRVLTRHRPDPPAPIAIRLMPAMFRPARMDWLIEKSTELGVERISPVHVERSVVRPSPQRVHAQRERWARLAVAAMKQSRRARVPRIDAPESLADAMREWDRSERLLVPWEQEGSRSLRDALSHPPPRAGDALAVLIGPEGGLSGAEADLVERAGGSLCTLGRAILRAETAAVAVIAAILYEGEGL